VQRSGDRTREVESEIQKHMVIDWGLVEAVALVGVGAWS